MAKYTVLLCAILICAAGGMAQPPSNRVSMSLVSSSFVVNEDAGTFSVDVNMEILNGNLSSLAVVFSTKDGTATSPHDYLGVTRQLMFDGTVTSHTVNIDIFQETEDVDADSEFFYLNLTLPNFQQRQKRLSIQVGELEVNLPDDTMVTVRDVKLMTNENVDNGLAIGLGVGISGLLLLIGIGICIASIVGKLAK